MSEPRNATFELEVDPASDPIAGLLRRSGRDEIRFSGWLGLASALERLLAEPTGGEPINHPHRRMR